MNDYLRRLISEREQLTTAATSITDTAAHDGDSGRDLTDTESATLAGMQKRAGEIDSQLKTYNEQLASQRAFASLRKDIGTDPASSPGGDRGGSPGGRPALESRSWGEQFIESDAFREYRGRGTSDKLTVTGILEQRVAADPIMLANIPHQYLPHQVHEIVGPSQLFPLIGLVSREVVSTNAVDFITWGPNPVPPAAIVPEGGLKPPVDIVATETSDTLDTYAGWKAVTRQTLEDFPRIQSIIESKLRTSLAAAISAAIAAILNAATASGSPGVGDMVSGIRAAIGDLQAAGYSPNGVAMHPSDWAALDIAALGALNPAGTWGLTPVSVRELTPGNVIVGDFKTAVTVFDRNQTAVFVSDSHADFFIRNQLVILAEQRVLVAPVEPAAMVKVDVGVAPTPPAARTAAR